MNTGTEGILPQGTNALRQEKLIAEWQAYYESGSVIVETAGQEAPGRLDPDPERKSGKDREGEFMPLIIAMQFAAKVCGGAVWSLLLHSLQRRAIVPN